MNIRKARYRGAGSGRDPPAACQPIRGGIAPTRAPGII